MSFFKIIKQIVSVHTQQTAQRASFIVFFSAFVFTLFPKEAVALAPPFRSEETTGRSLFSLPMRHFTTLPDFFLLAYYAGTVDHSGPLPVTIFSPKNELMTTWRLPEERRKLVEEEGDPVPDYAPSTDVFYELKAGEDASTVAKRFHVPLVYLQEINPGLNLDDVKEGDSLRAWVRAVGPSSSHGKANRGKLVNGEPLRGTEAIRVRHASRAFGTQHTVALIQSVIDDFHRQYPDTLPLMIGDISLRTGRRMRPHKSHQSGRDADISYPQRVEGKDFVGFVRATRRSFEVEKTFWLLKRFIDSGYVEYIFVDRRLQRRLVKFAKAVGAPQEWISAVFQASKGGQRAIIRHARGHLNHFHLRVRCATTDLACKDSFTKRREREKMMLEVQGRENILGGDKNGENLEEDAP